MSELNELDQLLEEAHPAAPPRNGQPNQSPDDGHPNREARYRAKHQVGDYSDDHLRKSIEARLHIHNPPPYHLWGWKRSREVAAAVFGADSDSSPGFKRRVGRVLGQLEREYPQVSRKILDGSNRFWLPPVT